MRGHFAIFKNVTAGIRDKREWPERLVQIPFKGFPELQQGDLFWCPLPGIGINVPLFVHFRELEAWLREGEPLWTIHCYPWILDGNNHSSIIMGNISQLAERFSKIVPEEMCVSPEPGRE